MRRKLICTVVLLLMVFGNMVFVSADETDEASKTVEDYHLLLNDGFQNRDTVTRYEALVAIMRAIGVNDYAATNWRHFSIVEDKTQYGWTFEELFFRDGDEVVELDMKYKLEFPGYAALAWYHELALGEKIGDRRYFFYDRPITVDETLTFMMRCLKGTKYSDMVFLEHNARMAGLIKDEDEWFEGGRAEITPEYFCVLMQRFLEQKRYLYFDYENMDIYPYTLFEDSERSMTYQEYLEPLK